MSRIVVHATGQTCRMGRKRPIAKGPRLSLKNYFLNVPASPASCDYTPKAAPALAEVYKNDKIGDCVIAGGYHVVGLATGNANGSPFIASDAEILADYEVIGGYNPNDPSTDQGCNEVTALNYWTEKGFADGSKLYAWLELDPSNQAECQAALYLFENLFFGMELPDEWLATFPTKGTLWDVAGPPNPNNGHCVIGGAYNPGGVAICSWGVVLTLSWAALHKYCAQSAGGALYVLVSSDQIAKAQTRAPNGLDWAALALDLVLMGGHLSNPVPELPSPPAPVPSPTPAPTPVAKSATLAEAQAILEKGWPK
jgi:hypothetical protein